MTVKQQIFANYLLKLFGFEEGDHFKSFQNAFYPLFDEHISWDFVVNKSVSVLLEEKEFRKNIYGQKIKKQTSEVLSASDIGSFVFCPASYSISKTFEIQPNEQMRAGTKFHQKGLLIAFRNQVFREANSFSFSKETKDFLSWINESIYIFGGHREDCKNEFFRNEKYHWVGQPDYIFQDKNAQYFVVEEKFRFGSRSNENFASFGAQLLSYIHLISEKDIKYGFLVIWNYEYVQEEKYSFSVPKITGCKIYKYTKDGTGFQKLEGVIGKIVDLKNSGEAPFDYANLNPVKCARCSNVSFCGHKTKKFSNITYPYHPGYLKLHKIPFPSVLVKTEEEKREEERKRNERGLQISDQDEI